MQPPPSKACPRCGEEKPRDPAHWYRDKSRRDGLARICSACAGEDLRRAKARARARQREMPASRGDLADLVLPSRAPLAAPLNFRTVLEEKARQRWPKLADTLLDLAEAGDKGALKLVVEQLIGHPTPARDDSGPERFWLTVLAAAENAKQNDGQLDEAPPDDDGDNGRGL